MSDHLITREIGIDAGHRVPDHASKCCHLHGHRYTIQATCIGPLAEVGEQTGMVLDFGFLKEAMMQEIDAPCDHGMILWKDDPWVKIMSDAKVDGLPMKRYIVPFVPTAENLARHWFERLAGEVKILSANRARLAYVKVWETPNCSAQYPVVPVGTMFVDLETLKAEENDAIL